MATLTNNKPDMKVHAIFARHETFHPRFGWLKKGFDKASEHNQIFQDDKAPAILGVGKNMAKAIKYWCIAYKVLEDIQDKEIGRYLCPTEFGQKLLADDGWDPYLEDIASLWLLHWNLLKLPNYATAWYYTFNLFNKQTFSTDELLHSILAYRDREFPVNKATPSSISRDINCLLRMYVNQANNRGFKEDSIDSPFVELDLIRTYGDSKHFAMNVGNKQGLSPEVVVAACLEFAHMVEQGVRTISFGRLLYDEGSPGVCFMLTESVLTEAIEDIAHKYDEISLSETAGLVQLTFDDEPLYLANELLRGYYESRR